MKILFLSPSVPFPLDVGGKLRTAGILNALTRNNDVYFLALHDPDTTADFKKLKNYVKDFKVVDHKQRFKWDDPLYKKILKIFYAILGIPSPVIRDYNFEFSKIVKSYCQKIDPDVVIVDFPWLTQYIAPLEGKFCRVLNTHNVESEVLRTTRKGLIFWPLWRIWRRYESHVLRKFDLIFVTSELEKKKFLELWPGGNYAVIPNSIDTRFFKSQPYSQRAGLVFTGTLNYWPNVEAVKFFVKDILPLIKKEIPDLQLNIVGSNPVPDVAILDKLPGVKVFANVPDTKPYIAGAAAAIVPIRSGSGTRLKILEAFALGTPVVSTTFGAAGLDVTPGSDILIADKPMKFANAIISVLKNKRRAKRFAVQARQTVESKYSWEAIEQKIRRVLLN